MRLAASRLRTRGAGWLAWPPASLVAGLVQIVEEDVGVQVGRCRDDSIPSLPRHLPVTLAVDFVIGQLVIGPLVTCCWRTGWRLGDILVDEVITLLAS